jgi:hypothetical protein
LRFKLSLLEIGGSILLFDSWGTYFWEGYNRLSKSSSRLRIYGKSYCWLISGLVLTKDFLFSSGMREGNLFGPLIAGMLFVPLTAPTDDN